jgi:Transposase DDE domain
LLAALLIALLQQNTANLARLANVLDLDAKKESKYKRLQRFLKHAPLTDEMLAKLLLAIVKPKGKYVLALDRTEWKYGAVWVNILTLSIVCGNTAIPLLWQTLNRKGNSTLAEKKALLERYRRLFGVDEIDYLCADREFDGYQFVQYLKQAGIPFRLRVKVSMKLTDKRGELLKCGKLLRTLKIGESYKLRRGRRYGGVEVFVEVQRGRDSKESVIVLASEPSGKILLEYKRRWAIETLFQNLKGRGFELEATHLREAGRIDKLFGVLALGVAWAVQAGEAESHVKAPVIKKNGRPQQSHFRLGCDLIQEVLSELKRYSTVNIFEILRC